MRNMTPTPCSEVNGMSTVTTPCSFPSAAATMFTRGSVLRTMVRVPQGPSPTCMMVRTDHTCKDASHKILWGVQ